MSKFNDQSAQETLNSKQEITYKGMTIVYYKNIDYFFAYEKEDCIAYGGTLTEIILNLSDYIRTSITAEKEREEGEDWKEFEEALYEADQPF